MHKQKNNKLNKNKGITLIALVLTIIVLLILAGVALSLALGQNGLIFKSRESKQKQEIALEKDRIMSAYGASFAHKDGKYDKNRFKDNLKNSGVSFDEDKLTTITDAPLKIELITKHTEYTVTYIIENGVITTKQIGQNNNSGTNNTIPADLKVGDTIIYDPTKDVTDTSKLTYTSVKGTAKTGGNGYGTQKVTAKSTNNEWIVISTANNQIKVISKELIGDVTGGENNHFTIRGGIGWLYAEEELHKACSIYGHGKGTIKTNTTYKVGNDQVLGEAKVRTLTDSGARSMTMEDLVKIMKGDQYSNFTDAEKQGFHSNEGLKLDEEAYYPTITSDSEDASTARTQKFNSNIFYIGLAEYDRELVTDQQVKANKAKLKAEIFKTDYYIAYRSIYYNYGMDIGECTAFDILGMGENGFKSLGEGCFSSGSWTVEEKSEGCLRPIVYLNGNMVEKVTEGKWKIKD